MPLLFLNPFTSSREPGTLSLLDEQRELLKSPIAQTVFEPGAFKASDERFNHSVAWQELGIM